MKQKKLFYAQVKNKSGTTERYQKVPIDIYEIEDENGVSLGKHLENIKKELELFKNQLDAEKKMRVDLIMALNGEVKK